MSKLFANSFMWMKGLDKDLVREAELSIPVKIRYLRFTKEYHFQGLDILTWLQTAETEVADFKIKETEISQFLKMDLFYNDVSVEETDYRTLQRAETVGLEDFYDDVYLNLCFIQRFYYLSKAILKEAKRQAHIWALGRAKSPWFMLTAIPVNKHGGRPIGGGGFGDCYLKREEQEILLDNLERYDSIIGKYAKTETSLLKFIYMHKELAKLGNKLPEWMQKPFMKREEGLTWYWHAVRYAYKKANGLELKPTAEEIKAYQKKYGFPFVE